MSAKKKINAYIKLQLPAGKANPSPPVGPALGQHGVNIMAFCKEFNAVTKADAGLVIPVVIRGRKADPSEWCSNWQYFLLYWPYV